MRNISWCPCLNTRLNLHISVNCAERAVVLPTGQLAAEQEGGVVGPHAVGAVVGLLHHLAALPPEVAAGHHLQ